MKELTMFYLPSCPHCKLALGLMEELKAEELKYRDIPVKLVDESREKALAESYDYWYVPCFFDGKRKLFEGHMEKPDVKKVLDAALE